MAALDPRVAGTLRAAAEVFVPGPPLDTTPGAGDISAEIFIAHYLDFVLPGLASGIPDLLDSIARDRFEERAFTELDLSEREAVLDVVAEHEIEQVRDVPALLGLLAIAAVYGEWTGLDGEGALTGEPLGWEMTGFDGPSRGRPGLLR